jgi:hypothetical protein
MNKDHEKTEVHDAAQPAQAAIPGTTPEQKPREPRSTDEIEQDFRMAKFRGKIINITEDWKNDRDFKITLSVPSYDRHGLAGLDSFNGNEPMSFRVLPVQPKLNDKAPEEFGDKVPKFGVAMIERLEKKSCDGMKDWEKLSAEEILDRINDYTAEIQRDLDEGLPREAMLKQLVDIANYAFFAWHNVQVGKAKAQA